MKNMQFSAFCRLFLYMKPHRAIMMLATVAAILNNIFDILPDVLIGIAVDVVVNQQHSFLAHLGIVDVLWQLYILGLLTCALWGLQALFQYLSEVLWRNLAQTVQNELRLDTYSHLQQLEMSFFEDSNTGDLLAIINDDINQLENFFDKGIIDGIYFLVNVFLVGVIFFYLAPLIGLLAFLPVPILIYISYRFQHRLGELYISIREHAGFLSARIANNIIGIATIKSSATEHYELVRLKSDSVAYKEINKNAIKVGAAFVPVVRTIISCGLVVTIILGGWYVVQGSLAVGSYSVLVSITQRLLWPFIYLAKTTDVYERSMACMQRVFSILDMPIGIKDKTDSISLKKVTGRIEFKNISFVYPSGIKIFDNISMVIEPGQRVGFVGCTGSGKTTLIKLLLRFYDPLSGAIFLDNVHTKDLALRCLRQSFGLVSQDIFLFNGSLKENIGYGFPYYTDEHIKRAAQLAEIHDFIDSLPEGYNTLVGERGQKLSSGQRQRISIARALINNPPIFIFDEATSSVDNETEALIQRSIDSLSRQHTICMIAHRLSTIRNADVIFVLDKGKIIEHGCHEALLLNNGMYAKLWRVQMGERMYL